MFTCGEVKYGSAGDDCILINLKTVGLLHYFEGYYLLIPKVLLPEVNVIESC